MKWRLFALISFGIAFGFVEAAVVYYLRALQGIDLGYPQTGSQMILNLGAIAFVKSEAPILINHSFTAAEIIREFSTIVMLAAIGFLSGKSWKQRLGAFWITFTLWDLFYYVFLKMLTGWPQSVWDIDIYFLIPVAWVGPVITPLIASTVLFVFGLKWYLEKEKGKVS